MKYFPEFAGIVFFSILLFSSSIYPSHSDGCEPLAGTQGVSASLTRVPQNVRSWRPVLIFAEVDGVFSTLRLDMTINLRAHIEGPLGNDYWWLLSDPWTRSLRFVPAGLPQWYVTCIPGLPARHWDSKFNLWHIDIDSSVTYNLMVDGLQTDSGSYLVEKRERVTDLPPVVISMAYSVLEEGLLNENFGLGPSGWIVGDDESFDSIIFAFDEHGLQTNGIQFEYRRKDDPWTELSVNEDPLMTDVKYLFDQFDQARETISNFIDTRLPGYIERPNIGAGHLAFGVYTSTIPSQSLGSYIQFRANATDIDHNSFTSPMGFYYVVNKASSTRVLIIDPWVKLWVLKESFQLLRKNSEIAQNYGLPANFKEGLLSRSRIVATLKENGIIPFHHWELLGKHYNLRIAWPGEDLVNLLNEQGEGGFQPHVVILSNLRFGLNIIGDMGFWNWDLNDIEVDGGTVQQVLIDYIKQHHAGLIATRGTLSDWVVWLGPESDQYHKVGARGHVGDSIEDLDILYEKTIASMLGMPQLALWEYFRDQVAQVLASNPDTAPVGMAVGSLPLQIPFVPLDSSLDATTTGMGHPILDGVDLPFDLPIPSVYSEFGFKSYTQVGWQLAMARHVAYDAWTKSNMTLPLVGETINRFAQLVENVTSRSISTGDSSGIRHSLRWALRRIYNSLISARISGTTFNATFDFHELDLPHPLTIIQTIDFSKLLQLLPVKLIACSENYTAGIVTHDKYWDENGYRSVYFSVEPEACNETVAETLLKNAVSWTLNWENKPTTTLLGDKVRVPQSLEDAFQNAVDSILGEVAFSDSILLVEEGHTVVEVNAATPGTIHLLAAHPTCEKVNITLMGGNGEMQVATSVAEKLTQAIIQAHEEGTIKISITADPDSSLNPAYIAVIPEFPSSDTTPPTISIVSPENKTYIVNDVPLTFTASESTSWTGYSLDGQANVTITGNTTLPSLSDGSHTIIVYANDTARNIGTSEIIYFSVETLELEPFPTWIIAVIVTIAGVGVSLLIYFTKFKKTTQKVK